MRFCKSFFKFVKEILSYLVDHFDFPKCQSIQPVNFHQPAFVVLLAQLKYYQYQNVNHGFSRGTGSAPSPPQQGLRFYKSYKDKISASPLPPSAGRNNFQSHILKWEGFRKKKCVWGGLKQFLPWIFAQGAYCFLSKKDLKIKYGFEDSISNADLGLFQSNNQLMFSFVTFWFCYIT